MNDIIGNTRKMPKLELFVMAGCPYCTRVLNYMRQAEIQMPIYDVYADPQAYKRLLDIGGKIQAPCLFIDGKPLYESADIVAYLQKTIA